MKLSTSSSSPPTADPSSPSSLDLTPSGGTPLSKLFSMCRSGSSGHGNDDDDDDDSYDTNPIFCGGSGGSSVRKVLFPSSSHRDDGDGIATVTSSTTSTNGVSKLSRSFGIGGDADIPSSIQSSSTSTPPPSPSRMNNEEDGDDDDESSSGTCMTQQKYETTEVDNSGLMVPITAFIVVVVALQYQHIVEFIGQQYQE